MPLFGKLAMTCADWHVVHIQKYSIHRINIVLCGERSDGWVDLIWQFLLLDTEAIERIASYVPILDGQTLYSFFFFFGVHYLLVT
jgi:hypothetical protein